MLKYFWIVLLFVISARGCSYTNRCDIKWGSRCIPFMIDDPILYRREEILSAVDLINTFTNAKFIEVNLDTLEESDSDLVVIRSGFGCSSFVGRVGGSQQLTLADGCPLYVIVHELEHVLGIFHEQSRLDRDNYVDIYFENILTGFESNFYIEGTSVDLGDYNYNSLMHYSEFDFTKNGNRTINARGNVVGQRSYISEGDVDCINAVLPECGDISEQVSCSRYCNPSCRGTLVCVDNECVDLNEPIPVPSNETEIDDGEEPESDESLLLYSVLTFILLLCVVFTLISCVNDLCCKREEEPVEAQHSNP